MTNNNKLLELLNACRMEELKKALMKTYGIFALFLIFFCSFQEVSTCSCLGIRSTLVSIFLQKVATFWNHFGASEYDIV